MSNKKLSKNLGSILAGVACLLALVAVLMMFAPAFTAKFGNDTLSYKGTQVAFGYTEKKNVFGSTVSTEVLKSNVLSMLAYLLPIVGIVLTLLTIFYKKSTIIAIIAIAVFVVAGIFAFASISSFPSKVIGNEYVSLDWKYGVGTILAAVFSLLAGALMAVKVVLKK